MRDLVKQYRWEKIRNNYILRFDEEHWVSYNPDTGADHFGAMLDSIIGEGGEETALVDTANPDHIYRILMGDWRDAYEKLVPLGFERCIDFFMENCREHGGQWSTHEKDRALLNKEGE